MKTILDFNKVPLDKWVDLYEWLFDNIDGPIGPKTRNLIRDIREFATTQVKTEEDYNREIVEALDGGATLKEVEHLFNARVAALQPKAEPAEPVENVIK